MPTEPFQPPARPPALRRGWLTRLAGCQLPSQCAVCHAWPAGRVCADCRSAHAAEHPRCPQCALRLPVGHVMDASSKGVVCADCLRHPRPALLDGCYAAVSYAWPWDACIDAFKFAGQPGWAGPLAQLMAGHAPVAHALQNCDVLLPMPLHPRRLAERGYNQSLLLARALRQALARTGGLHADAVRIRHDVLVRTRHTQPQSALPFAQRQRNVKQAFAVPAEKSAGLTGQRVVLLDDVMTTGASLHAAAQALRTAGVAHLTAIVLARTEKHG